MTLKYNSQYNESTEGEKESILNWLFGDHFFLSKWTICIFMILFAFCMWLQVHWCIREIQAVYWDIILTISAKVGVPATLDNSDSKKLLHCVKQIK